MRLPFPERLPMLPVCVFCVVLCLLQQAEGTTLLFSGCTVAFILLVTLAFNVAGGLKWTSGGFVFAFALIGVLFGVTYKTILGEPGQSNLRQPERTIEVYVATAFSLLVACYFARRFRLKRSYAPKFTSLDSLYSSSIGCLILGTLGTLSIVLRTAVAEPGSFLAFFNQINIFLPLAIYLGVTYEIKKSGGRRSVNLPVAVSMILFFLAGVFSYSKEGMLAPFIFWIGPAAAQRYRVSFVQVLSMLLGVSFIVYYLTPYSQYGRNFAVEGEPFGDHVKTNFLLLSNLELVRQRYNEHTADYDFDADLYHYYNKPQGFADRVQMVSPDDAIIDATEHGAVFGIFPTIFYYENIVPHIIWKSKPVINFGNTFAHELGLVADEDVTTGISFSPAGDGYHEAKWAGVLVMVPLLAFLSFFVSEGVLGDTVSSPFALMTIIGALHGAPEGGVGQFASETVSSVVVIVMAAYLCTRVMPLIGDLVLGRSKNRGLRTQEMAGPRVAAVVGAGRGDTPVE